MSMSINGVFGAYELHAPKNRAASAGRVSRTEDKKDEVALSELARDYKTAQAAVQAAPDVREEIVSPIKSRMDAGLYNVSAQMVADKILKGMGSV